MATLTIDGKKYEVKEGKNLLETCLSLGFDLPYFCWHPALGSVGSCRQCAVKQFKDENDKQGKLIMSCMEVVTDNMIISISDPEAVEFRKGIIEWLMINHPHDCPVCDEGGECHLQDMTVMNGHNYRRYTFNKRTYTNQYLGPFINHEMNRCIQCYRCVRFYRDYAGGRDFNVFSAHDHVYFGRHKDGILENEFAGNLIEICPTGVFTDKTLKKHYTRKWDLTQAPSVCTHCSLGCNIIAGERYGTLRRILARYNGEVNGYFLCDRGRFGYEFVNDGKRITSVLLKDRQTGELSPSVEDPVAPLNEIIRDYVVGIGSPRASIESNFMLEKLAGPENFYAGEDNTHFNLNKKIAEILSLGNVKTPSLKEIENADAVLILGEDIINTAPMMALAVRQAARNKPLKKASDLKLHPWQDKAVRELLQGETGPVFIATPYPTKLSDISAGNYIADPQSLADFGSVIAHIIDDQAPQVNTGKEERKLAEKIANALKEAERPLIISGTACLNERIIEAASNIAEALHKSNKNTQLTFAFSECNTAGLTMMAGKSLDELIDTKEKIDTLIVLENDLYRRCDKSAIDKLLDRCAHVIVLDHLRNATTEKADLVLPAGTFAESHGTMVNNEGRAQRFYKVFEPRDGIRQSWEWLELIMTHGKTGSDNSNRYERLLSDLAKTHPRFKQMNDHMPSSDFRIAGQKIPRESQRYSGRTSMHANENVHEAKPPKDIDSPLTFTMEGYQGQPPSFAIPFFWSPGWNSVQSVNKFQIEVGGHLHDGDPGVRLIEPEGNGQPKYFNMKNEQPGFPENRLTVVPCYHIFGSEELSSMSPPVHELSPLPYAGVSSGNADKLGLSESEPIIVSSGEKEYQLPVKIIPGLPENIIIIPAGLNDLYFSFSNNAVSINKPT